MREIIDKNAKCQNQLLSVIHKPKTNVDVANFKTNLSIQLKKFLQINFLKNFKIADESSVRKLRVFYLPLIGEKIK